MTDEVGQGNPPRGVRFGDDDHPMTRDDVSDGTWEEWRRETLSQYPNLAAEYLEDDDD